ncbi:uncharacterized protein LOC111587166 isoform X3 [Amphiprion ocellaris]|uniref:uncharacterized protein LOC111587166 isoform X3 n=1 Tax=Amphiprion ocellaris TaxID=80972 RepID=UPI0024118FB0|nr:uncharacterized protein LOC111587166 isoform X3 [Amphiprion ocellaris]
MSVLLREIRFIDPEAASVLEGADICTDSDIQFLSREDLRDLFPGNQELKRRKTIFDIIHKQKPVDVLLEGLRDFIPHESLRAALTGNGVLVDYLRILKNMKTQMDNVQTFLDAHINLLENISKPGPNQELQHGSKSSTSATTGPVEPYLNQPHDYQQGVYGSKSTTSATSGPVEFSSNQSHDYQQAPYGSKLITSATGGPVMLDNNQSHDYQQGAYGSKSTTSGTGGPVEPYINQPHDYQQRSYESTSTTSATSGPVMLDNNQPHERQPRTHGSKSTTSATSGPVMLDNNQPHERQPRTHGSTSTTSIFTGLGKPLKSQTDPQRTLGSPVRSDVSGEKGSYFSHTVKYQVFVSGETFGAHVQLMDYIKASSLNRKLQLVESNQDPQIIFVFCPIVSRLATDANAALEDVKVSRGQESIILVLMHHAHEVKCVTHLRTWEEYPNVVLHVHVFYHEKEHGLLRCRENKDAVSQIQSKLLEMHPCKYISADAQDEISMTGSRQVDNSGSHNDGDKNSDSKHSQNFFSRWLLK